MGDEVAMDDKIKKTDDAWRAELDPTAYEVLRRKGTERAFTGQYWDCHDAGTYVCAACQNELFSSDTKFESGTGWPSFTEPLAPTSVETETDTSHGMRRVEVKCRRCGGHLGHRFDDGPEPTGQRFCMNSAALKLVK
jgi:peptide-methionine (R)-S-oxide reductase